MDLGSSQKRGLVIPEKKEIVKTNSVNSGWQNSQ